MRICAGFLALLIVLAGCAGKETARRPAEGFRGAPVVLISIDTLRSDRLPAYGYATGTTPHLDALAKDAIVFERAYAHVPLTAPSHASLFTGRLPAAHGVRDNQGYRLSAEVETLASSLKRAGYATGGAVSAIVLARLTGLAQGFDLYDDALEITRRDPFLSEVQRPGAETARTLTAWIERQTGPFFAFLHVYEPHTPHDPPEPFRGRHADPYDGEVEAADAAAGELLAFLKSKGLYDRALVIAVSDHGEGLGDHGEDEHGIFLYREALQVPLLVKLPGSARAGERVAAPVGLFDVQPTVLKALGLSEAPEVGGNASLLEVGGAPARRILSETLYPRLHLGWSELRSLTDGRWHYIEAPRPEIYDLAADAGEKTNLLERKPDALRTMLAELARVDRGFAAPGAADAEHARKLAALGYLSSAAPSTTGPLPDPKDRIGLVNDVKAAFEHVKRGDDAAAAGAFAKLLEASPRTLDAWNAYAQTLYRLGRWDEAAAALRKGVELSGGSAHFLGFAAATFLKMGRLEDAEKHAGLARDAGDPSAHELLARVYLGRRDPARAEAAARQALEVSPAQRLPYLVLARVDLLRGNLPGALATLDRALALTDERNLPPVPGLHLARGEVLGGMGRPREAEAELRQELRLFPDDVDAPAGLAILYASERRLGDARQVLETSFGTRPSAPGFEAAVRVLTLVGDRQGADEWRRRGRQRFPRDNRFVRGS